MRSISEATLEDSEKPKDGRSHFVGCIQFSQIVASRLGTPFRL